MYALPGMRETQVNGPAYIVPRWRPDAAGSGLLIETTSAGMGDGAVRSGQGDSAVRSGASWGDTRGGGEG